MAQIQREDAGLKRLRLYGGPTMPYVEGWQCEECFRLSRTLVGFRHAPTCSRAQAVEIIGQPEPKAGSEEQWE